METWTVQNFFPKVSWRACQSFRPISLRVSLLSSTLNRRGTTSGYLKFKKRRTGIQYSPKPLVLPQVGQNVNKEAKKILLLLRNQNMKSTKAKITLQLSVKSSCLQQSKKDNLTPFWISRRPARRSYRLESRPGCPKVTTGTVRRLGTRLREKGETRWGDLHF